MAYSGITFTSRISDNFSGYIRQHNIRKGLLLTDTNTRQHCLPLLKENTFPVISMPAGEQYKEINTLASVLGEMLDHGVDGETWLFNLGGGVVSDMGGFAASIYRRGIRMVNIPTTLLAMVDAAIGGKNGIDFKFNKNYLGTFAMPEAVIVSAEFLKTLPDKEYRGAWAEIIKTAIIGSSGLMELVRADAPIERIIALCAGTKDDIVGRDIYDQGERQLLNFGHTIGHAYEAYRLSIGDPVMHGDAVARGMLYETSLAVRLGLLKEEVSLPLMNLIKQKLGVEEFGKDEFKNLLPFLRNDKKNTDERITFSLPTSVGSGKYGVKVPVSELSGSKPGM